MEKKFEDLAAKAKKLAEDSEELKVVREMAEDLAENASDFVRKYPIQSVLGAAAVGFLLASLLGRGRR